MASKTRHELKSWPWLLNPYAFPIITDQLEADLNAAELLVLSQTTKELGGLRDYTLKRAGNVDARLKDFVKDPQLFRCYLGDHNALISGSFALNTFEMGRLKDHRLDIYVEDGPKADHFELLIREREGYEHESEHQNDPVKPQSHKRLKYPCSVLTNSFTASPYLRFYPQGAIWLQASRHSNSRATYSTYSDFLMHNGLCQLPLVEQGIFHLSSTHSPTATVCSTKIPRRGFVLSVGDMAQSWLAISECLVAW